MQVRTKLYISLSAAILFAIAVIVFFINGNPQKWFWLCIFFASIIQNIVVLLKKNKEAH
ncbi:hypothetical protein ABEX53_28015 [Bacillus toyonensis]|jgi:cell division protein FtsW (lipid II flippase)|uniref:hypothetical protein n=1 Tax=Bacillus toyonensis TaxID=155322 RepID=UPI0002EA4F92|nr:hypothetical protein [Bacillus toyonensis]QPW48283.1 hypothetical protein G9298_11070 [Bacillus thuringiensis]MED3536962.1 hypothetical protein [Bacillus toyonensis]MEE2022475.1 hypothetical protein [Bacillus toyonensis]PGB63034.1 hypothetical protein COM00_11415 [Bacillus toyonensis]QQN81238.1 hypothetical protein I0K03_13240 [Bacillus toyonensis]